LRGGGHCRGDRGLAAGDADYAENGQLGEGGARNEDAVGGGVEIGRCDLHTVVEQRKQVVGDDAFEDVVIEEAESNPEAIEFGPAQKGFALRLKVIGELANEINGAHLGEGNLFVFSIGSKEINGIGMAEARRIHVAMDGFPVGKNDDYFLVRRGWSPSLQVARTSNGLICEML
jgi:hypothetical protein